MRTRIFNKATKLVNELEWRLMIASAFLVVLAVWTVLSYGFNYLGWA